MGNNLIDLTFTKIATIEITNKVCGWTKFELDANRNSIYWSGYYNPSEGGFLHLDKLNIQPDVQFTIKGNVRCGLNGFTDEIYYYAPDATLVVKYELRGTSLNPHFVKINQYEMNNRIVNNRYNMILRGTRKVDIIDASKVRLVSNNDINIARNFVLEANAKEIFSSGFINTDGYTIDLNTLNIPVGTQFAGRIIYNKRQSARVLVLNKYSQKIIRYNPHSQLTASVNISY